VTVPTRNFPFLLLIIWLTGGVAAGQEHRQRKAQLEAEPSSKKEQRRRPPGDRSSPANLGRLNPFRPSPADRGPLAEGEEQELLEFARREMPRAYRLLMRVRNRNPQAYQQQIKRLAPRARHLRRVFERDADLGRIIINHSENSLMLRRAREEWRRGSGQPPQLERFRRHARQLVAKNLRLETQAIERWITIREETRDRVVERKLRWLSGADALEWSGEPEAVRRKLEALQGAAGPERERLLAELRKLLTQQTDGEITRTRARAARLRKDATGEVDRRLNEYLKSAETDRRQRPKERGERKDAGRGRRRSPPRP
jgi:hypothetical protein